jgi:hypothetical protein
MKREGICLIQTPTDVDGGLLNNVIHDLGKRGQELRRIDLRVEENFRGEETFIANVNGVFLSEVGNQ